MVDVQKLRVFSILNMLARPSAKIVRVEALSLWRRANLLLAKWSLEVVAWFARLLSESRGRGVDPRLVRRSFSRQKSQLVIKCEEGQYADAAPAGKSQRAEYSPAAPAA